MTQVRWAAIVDLALAHHPACAFFRPDTFAVAGVRLCVGCWAAYTAAAAAGAMLLAAHVAWPIALAMGALLATAQILSTAGWTRTRTRKATVKAAVGMGTACLAYGIALAPWSAPMRLVLLAAGALGLAALTLPKLHALLATCDACPWRRDWDRCEGIRLDAAAPPRA